MESAFQGLAHQARATGWSESEVAAALIDLAHNYMRAMIADEKARNDIAAARLR